MCLIIDANAMGNLSGKGSKSPFYIVVEALTDTEKFRARLVIGGRLKRELIILKYARDLILELQRSGRVRSIPDESVDALELELTPECESDDPHVIAVAQLSGVRLLCTGDKTLMKDFKNKKFINKGKVYSSTKHKRLIADCCTDLR